MSLRIQFFVMLLAVYMCSMCAATTNATKPLCYSGVLLVGYCVEIEVAFVFKIILLHFSLTVKHRLYFVPRGYTELQ